MAQGGVEVLLYSFFNTSGLAPVLVWMGTENSPVLVFNPQTAQLVLSCYTDYAVVDHKDLHKQSKMRNMTAQCFVSLANMNSSHCHNIMLLEESYWKTKKEMGG